MEFLDNLVLPQSAEHIELLHYMLTLILFLFIPFISVVFGGTILSYLYKRKFNKEGKKEFLLFAKDTIKILPVNSSVGLILGVMTLLTVLLILVQLLHKSGFPTINDLALSFFLVSVGLLFVYTYRLTFALKLVFDSVKKENPVIENNDDFSSYYQNASKLSGSAVKFAIVLLFLGMWIFIGALTTVIYFDAWKPASFFATLFSARVLINFLIWICIAFSLTGVTLLFLFLFWKKDELKISEDYKNFVVSVSAKLSLYFSLPIPILLFFSISLLPDSHLSGTLFAYLLIAMILLFLSLNFLYLLYYKKQYNYAPYLFFAFLFSVLSLIVKDQITISNATKYHSVVLSTEYDKILAELRGEGKGEVINAAELYEVRCGACHKFDQKLVGPAHFDVLPKYEGKESQLVAFIRNPVKVDPAYPPMPNPGLKPAEAEAVAKYLLEEYQRLKK
jgi:cytochrome c